MPDPRPFKSRAGDYLPVKNLDAEDEDDVLSPIYASQPEEPRSRSRSGRTYRTVIVAFLTCVAVCLGFKFVSDNGMSLHVGEPGRNLFGDDCSCSTSDVPQYFQTSPELWPGPTATGRAPFMAQTRSFVPTATFVPNTPLQTAIPVDGMAAQNQSIFDLMGLV